MRTGLTCALALAMLLVSLAHAQDSPLVEGRTADMWVVDPQTGQVTGYDTGGWLDAVDPANYPGIDLDGASDVLLINRLPNSSVPMTPGQPGISLVGLGSVALLAGDGGQGGHRDLVILPAGEAHAETIAVRILVSSTVLATGPQQLTWSAVESPSQQTVAGGSVQLARYAGATGENGYYVETFYLVNNGTYNVTARLQGAAIDITEAATYTLTIDPADARRDTDGDGVPDAVEVDMGLNPLEDDWMADTDGNGWSEFDEWLRRFCLDPATKLPLDTQAACLDANDRPLDSDLDDWSDFDEILRGTNHLDPEPDIQPQGAAPPANEAAKIDSGIAQAPTLVNDATFCTDGSTFWFDLWFHADADDSISNDIILGVGADHYPFGNPNHSIRVNFGEQGQITRQEPIVRTGTTVDVTPLERWQVGPIQDFTIDSVGVEEWHIYGSVPVGADPFVPGDVVARIAIRSGVSGESGGASYPVSGNVGDCTGEVVVADPEYTEYVARQRLRYKDYPAANRLYEVEHLVEPGAGLLVVPPLASIQLDQQSTGANQGGYPGIVVQSFTPSQDNIAGVDVRFVPVDEGLEDVILNIWSGEARTGELLLSQRIEDVDLNADPARVIPIRFEPVAVQPGQPVYLEFRKNRAELVTTGADTLGGAGVIEVDGAPADGQTDLLFDVYYDANFTNGIGGTRAGMQWWTVGAADLDGTPAYDATTLLRDSEIASAGLSTTEIAPRRRMPTLATALGASQLPEMRLPAGESVVVSAVHRHHLPAQDGWRAPADYSRVYKAWLGRRDDVTPAAMLAEQGEGTWTTPDEWRRAFIAYLAPRVVVPLNLALDEASTLAVAVVEAGLSVEADLDDSGGLQVLTTVYQPGQPIYAYQPGQPQYGNLLTSESPYVGNWEDELERLAGVDMTLDDSVAEVTAALGSGQPLEAFGGWLRERFYAGVPGTASDAHMASGVLSAFPDVCFVPAEDVAARQANAEGWNAFLDQCPVWVSEDGLGQILEAERERAYRVRLSLLPGSAAEIAADAGLLDLFADSDADGATNSSEIERPVARLTLPWLFDSDGDSIADSLDPCQNDPYNECSADPILPTVTLDADFAVFEPVTGTGYALVSVQLDRRYDEPVTVCYEALADVGDTATPGSDFTVATGCIVIEAGQMSALIRVPVHGDGDLDGGETFTVRITSLENATSADDGLVVVTINDPQPVANTPPVFTSATIATSGSGSTDTGYTATAFDADGDNVTFGISAGADAAAFAIDAGTGVLSFVAAPDVNAPTDANGDNVYEVQLAADDGNGGSATLDVIVTVVEAQIYVEVTFPTPAANLGGGVTTLTVSGNVVDPLGNPIEPATISSIEVNGVAATLDAGNPGRWSAPVPVNAGPTTLTTTLTRSDASTSIVSLDIDNEYLHLGLSDIEMDTANNRAFVLDQSLRAVVEVDLATGGRSLVTYSDDGNSPAIPAPTGIAFDAANNRVLIADQSADAIIAVDLGSGTRSYVTRLGSVGAGPGFSNPWDVELDLANNRLLVVDLGLNALLGVDLATGDRTILSDVATGTGPITETPRQVVLDSANNRALVVDGTLRALVAIDLETGDRSVVSDGSTGSGPTLFNPNDVAFDPATGQVIVGDQTAGLIAVDLGTGDRTLLDRPGLDYTINASRIQGVGLDPANNRVIAADSNVDAIFVVDLTTTNRSILSDASVGTVDEPAIFVGIQGIAYDASGRRLIVADSYKKVIWQIDLATAHRSRLSDSLTGTGPTIDFPGRMEVDPANGVAYYLEQNANTLNTVHLETGDRVVVSGGAVGAGPAFAGVTDVALDLANGRAFVTDWGINAVFLVDLTTGDRTIVSDASTGTGPLFTTLEAVDWDAASGRAIIVDFSLDVLMAIDPATGDRTVLANNTGIGSGVAFSVPFDIGVDAANDRAIVPDYGIDQLLGVNLSSGDRVDLHPRTDARQLNLLNPYFLAVDLPNDRAFIYDLGVTGITVVDLSTGERAVVSK